MKIPHLIQVPVAVCALCTLGCESLLVDSRKTGGLTEKNLPSVQVDSTDDSGDSIQPLSAQQLQSQQNLKVRDASGAMGFDTSGQTEIQPMEMLSTPLVEHDQLPDDAQQNPRHKHVTQKRLVPEMGPTGAVANRTPGEMHQRLSMNQLDVIDKKLSRLMIDVASLEQHPDRNLPAASNISSQQLTIIERRLELLQARIEQLAGGRDFAPLPDKLSPHNQLDNQNSPGLNSVDDTQQLQSARHPLNDPVAAGESRSNAGHVRGNQPAPLGHPLGDDPALLSHHTVADDGSRAQQLQTATNGRVAGAGALPADPRGGGQLSMNFDVIESGSIAGRTPMPRVRNTSERRSSNAGRQVDLTEIQNKLDGILAQVAGQSELPKSQRPSSRDESLAEIDQKLNRILIALMAAQLKDDMLTANPAGEPTPETGSSARNYRDFDRMNRANGN